MSAEFNRFLSTREQSHRDRERMLEKTAPLLILLDDVQEEISPPNVIPIASPLQRLPRSVRISLAATAIMAGLTACGPRVSGGAAENPSSPSAAASGLPPSLLEEGMALPFLKPGRLTSGPHPTDTTRTNDPKAVRDGLDFSTLSPVACDNEEALKDWPIAASASGTVITVGNEKDSTDPNHSVVQVKHELGPKKGIITSYMHLDNMKIKKGQKVDIDTILGFASCEAPPGGSALGPHLHFSVATYKEKDNGTLSITLIPIRLVKLEGWEIQEGTDPTDPYGGTMTKKDTIRTAAKYACTTNTMCKGIRNDMARSGDIFVGKPTPEPTATPPSPKPKATPLSPTPTTEPKPTSTPIPKPTATREPTPRPPTATATRKPVATPTPVEKIPTLEPEWRTQKSLMGYQINIPPGWTYFAGPFDQIIKNDMSLSSMRIGHQKPTYGYDQDAEIQRLINNNPGIKAVKVKLPSGLTVWRMSHRSTMGGMATGSERIAFMFQGEEWHALIEERMFGPPALDQNKAVIDRIFDSFALAPR